jgi:hypothetical protein
VSAAAALLLILGAGRSLAGADLLAVTAGNAPAPLATPVPYTGQELVHPSVFFQAGGWNGFPYWMAVTPYPGSDAQFENPSLYCSLDGRSWRTPPGLCNPVAARPSRPRRYLSDPHLACGPDGLLRLFYRAAGGDQGGTAGWDRSIYRSCCLPLTGPEGTTLAIWYSAWGPDLGWRLGRTDIPPR